MNLTLRIQLLLTTVFMVSVTPTLSSESCMFSTALDSCSTNGLLTGACLDKQRQCFGDEVIKALPGCGIDRNVTEVIERIIALWQVMEADMSMTQKKALMCTKKKILDGRQGMCIKTKINDCLKSG